MDIEIVCQDREVLVCRKPAGLLSQGEGEDALPTLLRRQAGGEIYPVHRLDRGTAGLMVFARTGKAAAALSQAIAAGKLEKTYLARVTGQVSPEALCRLRGGVMLDDHKTAPAKARIVKEETFATVVLVTIHEGRNRQVRRMFEELGHKVLQLRRVRFGPLELGDLPRGKWRELTAEEVRRLQAYL